MILPVLRIVRACGFHLGLVSGIAVLAVPAYGQPLAESDSAPASLVRPAGEWGIRLGFNEHYRKIGLVYQTPVLWRYDFQSGWGHIDLNGEIAVSYWDAQRRQPDSMWQAGVTPMLRWWPNEVFYTEVGVGANVLSRSRFAGKNLSTAFQFGNHFGVGTVIGGSHRIGLRYSHYSNAGIKKPNPGLDLLQVTYSYRY